MRRGTLPARLAAARLSAASAAPRAQLLSSSSPNRAQASDSGTIMQKATLRQDASWHDCLIEPDQIQILRRRNGEPWCLGGGAYGQVRRTVALLPCTPGTQLHDAPPASADSMPLSAPAS